MWPRFGGYSGFTWLNDFHAFNFDLQRDPDGNLYYAKAGMYTDYREPGSIIRISPDGKKREIYCTGLRTPNGMGMMPDGRPTVSDNQGTWMPASKISLAEPGGYYGYVQDHASTNWAPGPAMSAKPSAAAMPRIRHLRCFG